MLVAALFTTACQSQVTTTLDLVVAAADAAVTALQATDQLPPGSAALLNTYLSDVTAAVDYATAELASADTPAVMASKITAEFAAIAVPQLPPGVAAAVGVTIQAVANAVAKFLSSIQATAAALTATPDGARAFFASGKLKLTRGDRAALPKIRAKNAAVKAKLAALKK